MLSMQRSKSRAISTVRWWDDCICVIFHFLALMHLGQTLMNSGDAYSHRGWITRFMHGEAFRAKTVG